MNCLISARSTKARSAEYRQHSRSDPARAAEKQCNTERIGQIGRGQDETIAVSLQLVELSEKGVHHLHHTPLLIMFAALDDEGSPHTRIASEGSVPARAD